MEASAIVRGRLLYARALQLRGGRYDRVDPLRPACRLIHTLTTLQPFKRKLNCDFCNATLYNFSHIFDSVSDQLTGFRIFLDKLDRTKTYVVGTFRRISRRLRPLGMYHTSSSSFYTGDSFASSSSFCTGDSFASSPVTGTSIFSTDIPQFNLKLGAYDFLTFNVKTRHKHTFTWV